jgi:tripartite-type tricarboxylate transporter receptor subunit TctC
LKEFIQVANRHPGSFNYSTAGIASLNHLSAEAFKRAAGVQMTHVPFAGGAPAVVAIVSQQVQFGSLSYPVLKPQIDSGRVKPLAAATSSRIPGLPNLPTAKEQGFPGLETYAWNGIFAPARTPAPVLQRFVAELNKTLAEPEVRAKLEAAGYELVGKDLGEFGRYLDAEYQHWKKVVVDNNIKLDE